MSNYLGATKVEMKKDDYLQAGRALTEAEGYQVNLGDKVVQLCTGCCILTDEMNG